MRKRLASRTGAAVVRAVLRAVATDRHRAPDGGVVLRTVEERVLALTAALHARPVAAQLRLVQDAEQGPRRAVDPGVRRLERGLPGRVYSDGERGSRRDPLDRLDTRCIMVFDQDCAQRFA